jgi:hypothetical protein
MLAVAIVVLGADSIRQIDFKNFTYPWGNPGGPLERWHWIPSSPSNKVRLTSGAHRFLRELEPGENPSQASGLRFVSVTYGDLERNKEEEAAVVLNYSGGGTANWDYLYIFKLENGAPRLLAWLESGSRADGGLVATMIENGQLVVDFADAKRRIGDCCSEGFIRVRYAWKEGHFVETGPRERGDLKLDIGPTQ